MRAIHPSVLLIWNKYKIYIEGQMLAHEPTAFKTLLYWQNWVFALAITYALPVSILILIPCFALEIQAGHYYIASSDVFAVGIVMGVTLNKRLDLHIRKILVAMIVTIIAASMLIFMGAVTMGFIYLLTISAFISLQFSNKLAYGSVVLNLVICAILGVLLYFEPSKLPMFSNGITLNRWLIYSVNFLFMNLVVVGLIRQLLNIMSCDIIQQRLYINSIEKNNEKLKEIAHLHSHIVRVPLANIKGLSALLAESVPSTGDKKLLDYLDDSVKQLDRVINEIVDSTQHPSEPINNEISC
ncbi:MAG: histidine kinase dimerization/phospho-acceptor domain-containing protein [Bacteroidota bacterium]